MLRYLLRRRAAHPRQRCAHPIRVAQSVAWQRRIAGTPAQRQPRAHALRAQRDSA
jgi:hypothetical protein